MITIMTSNGDILILGLLFITKSDGVIHQTLFPHLRGHLNSVALNQLRKYMIVCTYNPESCSPSTLKPGIGVSIIGLPKPRGSRLDKHVRGRRYIISQVLSEHIFFILTIWSESFRWMINLLTSGHRILSTLKDEALALRMHRRLARSQNYLQYW